MPFLSVVIPTYNRKESLRVTLDGLARQNYPREEFEAIVVSDGSTDGTDVFLTEYARQADYALRTVIQENAGPARARNRGIREAQGTVIVFLDDDVEPIPDFLRVHATHHEKDDRVVVIGPMLPDPARRRQEPAWIAWEHAMLEKQYANFRSGVWQAGPHNFYSGNASLRRDHLLAVGGFDEDFKRQEDVELAFRISKACAVRFTFDHAASGIHRPHRSFDSWLRVPYAYGQLDVVRARQGNASWDVVRNGYRSRNRATRGLADICLAAPLLSPACRGICRTVACFCHFFGLDASASAVLSALYNVRYLEGAQKEMGTRRLLHDLLFEAGTSA